LWRANDAEGCGCSGGINEEVYAQTLLGYLVHPSVHSALLLEHGCEKTHNHAMMEKLQRMQIPVESFGWASVQLDGGIEKAKQRVEEYFVAALQLQGDSFPDAPLPSKHEVDLSHLRVGLLTAPTRAGIPPAVAKTFAAVSQAIASHGGVVVVPSNQGLLSDNAFVNAIVDTQILGPSLLYGQTFKVRALTEA
jgi:altronate dehydratase